MGPRATPARRLRPPSGPCTHLVLPIQGPRTHPPPAPLPNPCTHLSLLELVGGRSGLGFRPRGLDGGFSAAEEKRSKLARIWWRGGGVISWRASPSPTQPRPHAAAPANLPGFRPRGGFLTDTSESEEEEEEEAEDDDGDLTGGTGSALAASDSALESESDADGTFWRRPGRVRRGGGGRAPLPQMETFPSGLEPEAQAAAIHPVRVSAPAWTTPSSAGDTVIETY